MKTLELKDGSFVEFIDSSTINNLTTVVENFNAVETLRTQLSVENLSKCTFDGYEYSDILLDMVSVMSKGYGNVQVTFIMKTLASDEIAALRSQVEALEAEKVVLSDKAEAADILLGNEEVE